METKYLNDILFNLKNINNSLKSKAKIIFLLKNELLHKYIGNNEIWKA